MYIEKFARTHRSLILSYESYGTNFFFNYFAETTNLHSPPFCAAGTYAHVHMPYSHSWRIVSPFPAPATPLSDHLPTIKAEAITVYIKISTQTFHEYQSDLSRLYLTYILGIFFQRENKVYQVQYTG